VEQNPALDDWLHLLVALHRIGVWVSYEGKRRTNTADLTLDRIAYLVERPPAMREAGVQSQTATTTFG